MILESVIFPVYTNKQISSRPTIPRKATHGRMTPSIQKLVASSQKSLSLKLIFNEFFLNNEYQCAKEFPPSFFALYSLSVLESNYFSKLKFFIYYFYVLGWALSKKMFPIPSFLFSYFLITKLSFFWDTY